MKKLLEICCCSLDDALQAEAGGANRIELNSALEAGGLTPSLGCLIEVKKRLSISVIAMLRPRTGGFCYTEMEFETMLQDAELLLQHGADGLAVGILTPERQIDFSRVQKIVDICRKYQRESVFHRAIDVTPDPVDSVRQLIKLGVTRILTSGGAQRCLEGIGTLNRMIQEAGNQIEILGCGSVRPDNLADIMSETDCSQFHMACTHEMLDPSGENVQIRFNGIPSESSYKMISRKQVEKALELLTT